MALTYNIEMIACMAVLQCFGALKPTFYTLLNAHKLLPTDCGPEELGTSAESLIVEFPN